MCVFFFDVFKHLLLRKPDVLKTCRKSEFLRNFFLKKCTSFEEQKRYKVYSGKRLLWHYYLQLSFVYKTLLRFLLNCFVREIKGFYPSSLGNEVDFRDIMKAKTFMTKI